MYVGATTLKKYHYTWISTPKNLALFIVISQPRQMIRTNADYCIILIETKRLKENVCPQIQWIENLYSVHYRNGLKHHRQWCVFYDKKEISMIMNTCILLFVIINKQYFEIDKFKMINSKYKNNHRNHNLWINEPYLILYRPVILSVMAMNVLLWSAPFMTFNRQTRTIGPSPWFSTFRPSHYRHYKQYISQSN